MKELLENDIICIAIMCTTALFLGMLLGKIVFTLNDWICHREK